MIDPPDKPELPKNYQRLAPVSRSHSSAPSDTETESPDSLANSEIDEPFDPSASLRTHPLARAPSLTSFKVPFFLFTLIVSGSLVRWRQLPQDHWAARQDWIFDQGEYWRCLSSLAAHSDLSHLLSNASLFLLFAFFLHHYFGWLAFPVLSLIGGALTMGLTVLSYSPEVKLLGASGMVYFMNGLWLWLFVRYADYLSFSQRISRCLAFTLVVLVPTQFEPNVSYRSHAIGFGLGLLIGAVTARFLAPKNLTQRTEPPQNQSFLH